MKIWQFTVLLTLVFLVTKDRRARAAALAAFLFLLPL